MIRVFGWSGSIASLPPLARGSLDPVLSPFLCTRFHSSLSPSEALRQVVSLHPPRAPVALSPSRREFEGLRRARARTELCN